MRVLRLCRGVAWRCVLWIGAGLVVMGSSQWHAKHCEVYTGMFGCIRVSRRKRTVSNCWRRNVVCVFFAGLTTFFISLFLYFCCVACFAFSTWQRRQVAASGGNDISWSRRSTQEGAGVRRATHLFFVCFSYTTLSVSTYPLWGAKGCGWRYYGERWSPSKPVIDALIFCRRCDG